LLGPATKLQPDGNGGGFCSLCAADRRPPEAKEYGHEDAAKLAMRVAAAALALSACGIAARTAGGTPVAYASVASARHAPGDTRFAGLRAWRR
jgi:hypothetical protein